VNPEPFRQLDRVIHEKGRLAIMSLLAASAELSFTEMRDVPRHDRREYHDAHPHPAGGGLCGGDQIVPEQSATDHLLHDAGRTPGVRRIHRSPRTNRPPIETPLTQVEHFSRATLLTLSCKAADITP
jgi:hypothetical protein